MAIVGYGPVGQGLAIMLARAGHRVIVLERHPDLYPLPRACHLDGETMRILQSVGVASKLEPMFHRQRGYEFFDETGNLMHRIDFTADDGSGWNAGYFFFGPDLERAMHEAVLALPNVETRFSHTVGGFEIADQIVHLDVEDRDGEHKTVRTRYLVGADGANSTVRQLGGIAWDDLDYEADWLVVDLRPRSDEITKALPEASQILDPSRPVSAFRWIGKDHARLEFMLLPGEHREEMQTAERVWSLLEPFEIRPDNAKIIRRVVYTFRSLLAETFDAAPIFLVGDAAHLMPPFLGQGMCSGFRDAAALSWRLDIALRQPVGTSIWLSYTAERRRHVRAVIDGSIAVGDIIGATPETLGESRTADQLRTDFAKIPGVLPPLQEGAIAGDAMLAGTTFPQHIIRVPDGKSVRFDDALGRQWFILLAEDDSGLADIGGLHVGRIPVPVFRVGQSFDDLDGGYGAWFQASGTCAALVRPDGLVFGACANADDVLKLIHDVQVLVHQ